MRLVIDMDGVLVDMLSALVEQHNRENGKSLTVEDIVEWDLSVYGIPDADFQRPGFFYSLKPYPGAVEAIRELSQKHEIIIATNNMGIDFVKREKMGWIFTNLPYMVHDWHFTSNKAEVPGDIILDDCPAYLETYPGITVAMDRPYNRYVKTDYRVKDMREFAELIQGLEANK